MDRRRGLDAACDLGHEHLASGLVHRLAAAACRDRARPAPARRHADRAGDVHRPPDGAPVRARVVSATAPTPRRSRAAGRQLFGRDDSAGGRRPEPRAVRGAETVVLLLAGLLLAIATVNDVVLRTHTNHRLVADLRTWRLYTGHGYHNLSV